MLSLFATHASSLRPVFIIPPMYGSVLYANVTNLKSHWYCSSDFQNKWIWIAEEFAVPPVTNCLWQYLTMAYDESTQRIASRPEVQIQSIDWGGDQGILYIDSGIFGIHFVPDLLEVVTTFERKGYEPHKTLFGAPHDWRFDPYGLEDFYAQLKSLIEYAYTINDKTPICAYCYSAGSNIFNIFCSTVVDAAWKAKYINRVIFSSPSYPGSSIAFEVLYEQTFTALPDLYRTADVSTAVQTIPTVYGHLYNPHIYGDRVVVTGPNGEKYTASQLIDFLRERGKVLPENEKIVETMTPVYSREILDPGVDAYFLINAGRPSVIRFSFPDGWDQPYQKISGFGDGTLADFGLYYGSWNWNKDNKYARVYHNVNQSSSSWTHMMMVSQEAYCKFVYKAATEDDWMVKGTHNITGIDDDAWSQI